MKKMAMKIKNKKGNSRSETVKLKNIFSVSKRSQVTVFVILAIGIVIVLLLLFLGRDRITTLIKGQSPLEQIKECAGDYTQEAVDILSSQGGSLEPEFYYLYQGNKIEYLCYTSENYKQCVMQKPLIKQSIEKEIEGYIEPKIKSCMNSVKSDLEKNGYLVNIGDVDVDVEIVPENVLINIQSDLSMTKGTTESYKSIKTDLSSNLYEFVMIASSILNWEARYGDAETMNYMLYYPSLKVEKKIQGDGTKIYILTSRGSLDSIYLPADKSEEDKFVFASRSMVIPAGITGE